MSTDISSRITIALIPEAEANLAALTARTGLSKTDLVNRAVTLYEFIDSEMKAGHQVLIRDQEGAISVVTFPLPPAARWRMRSRCTTSTSTALEAASTQTTETDGSSCGSVAGP
jgi:hypothetical protein